MGSSFDWDAYKSGTAFIKADEKQVIAENGIPFEIVGIRQVFKFENENFELAILLPNPETGEEEERTLSFAIGSGAESRDNLLKGLKGYLDDGGAPQKAKLVKVGRAFFVGPA